MTFTENPIIYLDCIDSTNNYAMQMINDDKAFNGLTIVANKQTNGQIKVGLAAAIIVVESRSSAMPDAIFPIMLPVAGAITNASANCANAI